MVTPSFTPTYQDGSLPKHQNQKGLKKASPDLGKALHFLIEDAHALRGIKQIEATL